MTKVNMTLDDLKSENGAKLLYDMLFNFKGYGNPNGKYWFMGQEENWDKDFKKNAKNLIEMFSLAEENIRYYSNPIQKFCGHTEEKFFNRVEKASGATYEKGIVKILKISENDKWLDELRHNTFITNLRFFPLKKSENKKVFLNILQTLGVNHSEKTDFSFVDNLSNFMKESHRSDRKIFTLSGADRDYPFILQLFGLRETYKHEYWERGVLQLSEYGQIYLAYHPSYGNFSQRLEGLLKG